MCYLYKIYTCEVPNHRYHCWCRSVLTWEWRSWCSPVCVQIQTMPLHILWGGSVPWLPVLGVIIWPWRGVKWRATMVGSCLQQKNWPVVWVKIKISWQPLLLSHHIFSTSHHRIFASCHICLVSWLLHCLCCLIALAHRVVPSCCYIMLHGIAWHCIVTSHHHDTLSCLVIMTCHLIVSLSCLVLPHLCIMLPCTFCHTQFVSLLVVASLHWVLSSRLAIMSLTAVALSHCI